MTSIEDQQRHKLELMTAERNDWRSRTLVKAKKNLALCATVEKLEKQIEQLKKQIR